MTCRIFDISKTHLDKRDFISHMSRHSVFHINNLECFCDSFRYVGMLSGLKLLALALFLYDLYQLRKIEKEEEAEEAANNALEGSSRKATSNSTISLDKCKPSNESPSPTTKPISRKNSYTERSSTFEREPMLC